MERAVGRLQHHHATVVRQIGIARDDKMTVAEQDVSAQERSPPELGDRWGIPGHSAYTAGSPLRALREPDETGLAAGDTVAAVGEEEGVLDRAPGVVHDLADAGITMHGADYLFYFADAVKDALLLDEVSPGVRQLTEHDSTVFAEFQAAASDEDRDGAHVELGHWAAFGAFEHGIWSAQPARIHGEAHRLRISAC